MTKDIFGNTLAIAVEVFGEAHSNSRISLFNGIWVARFVNRPDAYAQKRGAWKPQVGYAAISRNRKIVSNGTRTDTIKLAKA
jgi:hypothetical protein